MSPDDIILRSDTLSRQNVLLKSLWVRELMRRGATEEVYTRLELDYASQNAAGWMVRPDGDGNYFAEWQS